MAPPQLRKKAIAMKTARFLINPFFRIRSTLDNSYVIRISDLVKNSTLETDERGFLYHLHPNQIVKMKNAGGAAVAANDE